jgi:hypothetical protein
LFPWETTGNLRLVVVVVNIRGESNASFFTVTIAGA